MKFIKSLLCRVFGHKLREITWEMGRRLVICERCKVQWINGKKKSR